MGYLWFEEMGLVSSGQDKETGSAPADQSNAEPEPQHSNAVSVFRLA